MLDQAFSLLTIVSVWISDNPTILNVLDFHLCIAKPVKCRVVMNQKAESLKYPSVGHRPTLIIITKQDSRL